MSDGWHRFTDSHGVNNAYPTSVCGLEFHVHGADFEGPAQLKLGNDVVRDDLTPGEALHEAAMHEFQRRFGQSQ